MLVQKSSPAGHFALKLGCAVQYGHSISFLNVQSISGEDAGAVNAPPFVFRKSRPQSLLAFLPDAIRLHVVMFTLRLA
jgi:hypothetical protein